MKTSFSGIIVFSVGEMFGKGMEEAQTLRIGLLTDTHYADREPAGSRFYRESKEKMRECIRRMNRQGVDLVVHIGDFKDQDEEPNEARTLSYLEELEGEFAQFKGPRYHVLGNHDMDSISKRQFLERVENTGIESWRSFYSVDHKGVHIVVLDANFRHDGADYDKGDFDWRDANIPENQLEWLRNDLAQTSNPVIVFVHQLLDTEQSFEHQVKNGSAVREILEGSGKVLAVFQGHQHKGGYHLVNGIHYYTLPAMIEGSGKANNSYAILEVRPDRNLHVRGYRRVEDQAFGREG